MTTAAPFDLVVAGSVDEAVGLLAGDRQAAALAGGQSLLALVAMRTVRPAVLVDINELGLDAVVVDRAAGLLRLGALVRHRTVERSAVIGDAAPLLAAAAAWVGHPAVRHRGTLGGSLTHADPAAELPAAVVALGGEVVVRGPQGTRRLPAADLTVGPFETALAPGELVVEVAVPHTDGPQGAAFCEWAPRHRDRAEAGVGVTVSPAAPAGAGRPAVGSAGAAACGVGAGPVDLTAVVGDAVLGEPVAGTLPDALVRHLSGAIAGTCREHGADDDRAELAGAVGARAAVRAVASLEAATCGRRADDA